MQFEHVVSQILQVRLVPKHAQIVQNGFNTPRVFTAQKSGYSWPYCTKHVSTNVENLLVAYTIAHAEVCWCCNSTC